MAELLPLLTANAEELGLIAVFYAGVALVFQMRKAPVQTPETSLA